MMIFEIHRKRHSCMVADDSDDQAKFQHAEVYIIIQISETRDYII